MPASTDYDSNYPEELYGGNLQEESTSQDAEVIARARDYNIHDVEIRALQQTVGTLPEGTDPSGSVLDRLNNLQTPSHNSLSGIGPNDHHDQAHGYDSGTDHTGTLSTTIVQVSTTGSLGMVIDTWINKVYGTGDIDGDGVMSVMDVLAAMALNKELLDDFVLTGRDSPWQVPTGGGPGKPGGGGGGGGLPPGTGGPIPGDPTVPDDDVWTGLGPDGGGNYSGPVGLLVDFDTGGQYPVQRYRDASSAELKGIQKLADIEFADTWGSPAAGTNYVLFFARRAPRSGITTDGTGVTYPSVGAVRYQESQAALDESTDTGIIDINLGNRYHTVPMLPKSGTSAANESMDPGWAVTMDIQGSGEGTVDGSVVVPDAGTYDISLELASTASIDGLAWHYASRWRVNGGSTTDGTGTITPSGATNVPFTWTLDSGISLAAGDMFDMDLSIGETGPHTGNVTVWAIRLLMTTMG